MVEKKEVGGEADDRQDMSYYFMNYVYGSAEKGVKFVGEFVSEFRQLGVRKFYAKRIKPFLAIGYDFLYQGAEIVEGKVRKIFSYRKKDVGEFLLQDAMKAYKEKMSKPVKERFASLKERVGNLFLGFIEYEKAMQALRRQPYLRRQLKEAEEALSFRDKSYLELFAKIDEKEIREARGIKGSLEKRVKELEGHVDYLKIGVQKLKPSQNFYNVMDEVGIAALVLQGDIIRGANKTFCEEFEYSNENIENHYYTEFLVGDKEFYKSFFTNPDMQRVEEEITGKNKKGRAIIHKIPILGYRQIRGQQKGKYKYTIVMLTSIKWEEKARIEAGKAEGEVAT